MFKEFREFALRGNVMDLAIGIVIGTAFSAIVNSLVKDILMPPLGLLLGDRDFSRYFVTLKGGDFATLAEAQAAGAVTLNYGQFLSTLINFTLIALALFVVVRAVNRLRREEDTPQAATPVPSRKDCPYCLTTVPLAARRCPACTSQLESGGRDA